MSLIKKELLDILACPADKGELREIENISRLECLKCGLKYPVREGIPVMLLDEAEAPPVEEKREAEQGKI